MSKYRLQKNDYYPTAPSATEAVLARFKTRGTVWECAAGKGHMADVIARYAPVLSSDIIGGSNFLEQIGLPLGVETIMTNPPYSGGLADDFIRHALKLIQPTAGMVLMLLKVKFDCGKTRKDIFAHHPAFHAKLILTERMLIPGFRHKAQPLDNHAWYIWDWQRRTPEPCLFYA